MEIYHPTIEEVRQQEIFPESLIMDTDVFFHGTSDVNESVVEKEGLLKMTEDDPWVFQTVIDICQTIHAPKINKIGERSSLHLPDWSYIYSREQYALKDIENNAGKVFLGATDINVLRYASIDLAGGENMHGIYLFHNYLAELEDQFEVLEKQRELEWHLALDEFRRRGWTEDALLDLPPVDYELIKDWKQRTQHLYQEFVKKVEQHQYGLIYAVNTKGLASFSRTDEAFSVSGIPPERIVAKGVIPIINEDFKAGIEDKYYMKKFMLLVDMGRY